MTRAPKKKQPACVDGQPHHWLIATTRCAAGFYPGTCRNCKGEREFWGGGPDDPARFFRAYQNTAVPQVALFSQTKRRPSDVDSNGSWGISD